MLLMSRGHNEGSLFQRKSGAGKGRWVALVTMRDGRRVSRWAKDRDGAKVELAELLRLRDAGAPMTGRVRLGAYLERWIASDHGLAPATRRKHESIIRVHLVPALGHIPLSQLRVVDVEQALSGQAGHLSGLGPQSLRHVRATLRRALADAGRDGLVLRNVGGLARPPKLPNRERTILDATQARILIESTRDTRYGPLWTILVTTGLRISEALGLMWSSVDFGNREAGAAVTHATERGPTGQDPASQGGTPPGYSGGNDGREHVDETRPAAPLPRRMEGAHDQRSVSVRTKDRDTRRNANAGPSLTVRHQLARENGEWVRRQPKTAKGRRTIPLTPLGVEALRAQRAMQREWRFGDGGSIGTGDAREDLGGADTDGLPEDGDDPAVDRGLSNGRVLRGGVPAQRLRAGRGPETGMGFPVPIDGLVFTSPTGHPLHGTNVVKRLADDLAAAGLPHVTAHDLRHSAATILFSQGLPIEAIADLLGHSTVRVTQDLYRHHVKEFSVSAAEKMQAALG